MTHTVMRAARAMRRLVSALVATSLVVSAAALCGALVAPQSVRAQDYPSAPPPPVHSSIDTNGVDLISGSLNLSGGRVSIGSAGAGGLAFDYLNTNSADPGAPLGTINYDGVTAFVSIGGRTEKFSSLGGCAFAPAQGQGSTLNCSTYTAADGTIAVFSYATRSSHPRQASQGNIVSLTKPTGEKLTFTYKGWSFCGYYYYSNCMRTLEVQRIKAISSNLGYQLHFTYHSDGVTVSDASASWTYKQVVAINTAMEYCDSNADTCTGLTQSWPVVNFTGTANGSAGMIATDAAEQATVGNASFIRRPSGAAVTKTSTGTNSFTVSNGAETWTYAWFDNNDIRTMVVTDPLQHTRTVVSNQTLSRMISDTDALGHTTSYTYDTYGRMTRITQPEGDYAHYTYDSRGNITELRRVGKPGSGLADIVTKASYDATCANPNTCNKPNSVTDERDNVTSFTYDATHGGVLTATSPAGRPGADLPQTRYTYSLLPSYAKNSGGTLVQVGSIWKLTGVSTCTSGPWECVGGSLEAKSTISYAGSPNLQPTLVTNASGDGAINAVTAMTYDQYGNLKTVNGPLAGSADTTRTYYNATRQVVGEIGPDPDGAGALLYRASRTTYNADGQATTVETGTATNQSDTGMTTFASLQTAASWYDAQGRKSGDGLIVGGVTQAFTQYGYDAAGRQICTTVRMNPAAFGSAPGACSLGTAGPDGPDRITYTAYDSANRVTQVISGYGTSGAYAPRIEKAVTYTDNGLEQTVADGKGNLTTYAYDGFDRLMKVRYPNVSGGGSSTTDYDGYCYDPAGNLKTWRRRHATGALDCSVVTFTYDALNRAENGLRGEAYGYDNLGRRTSATHAAQTASATYDALGRMKTETTNGLTLSYQYDLAGRRTRMTWPDGVHVSYSYDVAGQVQNIFNPAGTALAGFGYDNLGRRTGVWRGPGVGLIGEGRHYDAASRLDALGYDLAGAAQDQNWDLRHSAASQVKTRIATNALYEWSAVQAAKSYTVNGLNQYDTAAGTAIAYDARGNLSNDGTRTYGYDLLNNLTSVSGGVTLAYEPTGRLWQVSSGATTTNFLYSGPDLVAEYGGATLLRRYVPGPGTDAPMIWYEGAGTAQPRYLLPDMQGSIIAVVDAAGASIASNTYDEYGVPAAGNLGRFQYTGQAWLPEVGLYHYKARAYSPTLGRFPQTDPIGYEDGLNWYAYVGNDPVNMTDPSGLDEQPVQQFTPVDPVIVSSCAFGVTCLSGQSAFYFSQDMMNGQIFTWSSEIGDGSTEIDPITITAQNPQLYLAGSQRGGNNFGSTEYKNFSDEELREKYKTAKGQERVKLQRELKSRGVRNINKVRGGGIMSAYPIIVLPGWDGIARRYICSLPNAPNYCSVT